MAGILGSLVSITAICGVVRPGESLAIGFIGSAIAIFGWQVLNKFHIDDPVGAVSTHAGGSIWGMIAVGLFVEKDSLQTPFSSTYGAFKGGHVRILGVQLLACVAITAWTLVTVTIQLVIIDKSVGLRLSLKEEILGADVCEHGIDQSQINAECHLKPVPALQNKVVQGQTGERQESAEIGFNDNNASQINDTELVDYQESYDEIASDGVLQRNADIPGIMQSTQDGCKPGDNGDISTDSSKKRWRRALESTTELSTFHSMGSEEQRKARSSFSPFRRKTPVIITLTPANDDRAYRLSVGDLKNFRKQ